MKILGTHRIRTTAYHPMSNGIIECFHCTLKAALRAHGQHTPWINTLPLVLLGIKAAVKEDLGCSTAELVYGFTLCLPGQFFLPSPDAIPDTTYISKLKSIMTKVCLTLHKLNHPIPLLFINILTLPNLFSSDMMVSKLHSNHHTTDHLKLSIVMITILLSRSVGSKTQFLLTG